MKSNQIKLSFLLIALATLPFNASAMMRGARAFALAKSVTRLTPSARNTLKQIATAKTRTAAFPFAGKVQSARVFSSQATSKIATALHANKFRIVALMANLGAVGYYLYKVSGKIELSDYPHKVLEQIKKSDSSTKYKIVKGIAQNIEKYYNIADIMEHCDARSGLVLAVAVAQNVQNFESYTLGKILEKCDDSQKRMIITALKKRLPSINRSYDYNSLVRLITSHDKIPVDTITGIRKVVYDRIVAYQPCEIPTVYMWVLEKDKTLQREVIKTYLGYDALVDIVSEPEESHVIRWQAILSEYSLNDLLSLMSETKKENEIQAISLELAVQFKALQRLHKHVLEARKKQSYKSDEAIKHYREIAKAHKIEIPQWVKITVHDSGSVSNSLYIHIDQEEVTELPVLLGALGHELGHIINGDHPSRSLLILAEETSANNLKNYLHETEYAADLFACMASDQACRGQIKYFSEEVDRFSDWFDPTEIGEANSHPSHTKRIEKMQQWLEYKKRYAEGWCWNPLYKQTGGPEWYKLEETEEIIDTFLLE